MSPVERADAVAGAHSSDSPALLLTVAICTRNRCGCLQRAIESVVPQLNAHSELLIVDNASMDGTLEIAHAAIKTCPRVRFLREPEIGLSAARNTALLAARGSYVVFLDDDATADAGWLKAYQDFLSNPPSSRIGAVGGAVYPVFESQPPKWVLGPSAHRYDPGGSARTVNPCGGPWGCNIAYHRESAIAVGKFDRKLGRKGTSLGAHEETDLNLRLVDAGMEIWWLPNARIRHFITAERFDAVWRLRSQFCGSQSSAIVRLRTRRGRCRYVLYGVARLLTAPFHCALIVSSAVLTLPFTRQDAAFGALLRTAHVAGLASGLVADAFNRGNRFLQTLRSRVRLAR